VINRCQGFHEIRHSDLSTSRCRTSARYRNIGPVAVGRYLRAQTNLHPCATYFLTDLGEIWYRRYSRMPSSTVIYVKIGTVKAYCSYGLQNNCTDSCDIQKVKNASLMTSLSHGVQHWPVRSPYRQRSCVSHNKVFPEQQALRQCVLACALAHCESVLQHWHTAGYAITPELHADDKCTAFITPSQTVHTLTQTLQTKSALSPSVSLHVTKAFRNSWVTAPLFCNLGIRRR